MYRLATLLSLFLLLLGLLQLMREPANLVYHGLVGISILLTALHYRNLLTQRNS